RSAPPSTLRLSLPDALPIFRDVEVLADALVAWYGGGDENGLRAYSERCLRSVWRAEHFSWWMTSMLHEKCSARQTLRRQRSEYRSEEHTSELQSLTNLVSRL